MFDLNPNNNTNKIKIFKQKDPSKREIEIEFMQMTHQYIEEFFIFLKKIEPLLLIITLLIALYSLLSFQTIPVNVENIADKTLNSIASFLVMIYLGIMIYWLFQLAYKRTICQINYNYIIPLFLGLLGTTLLGAGIWISNINSDSSSPPVIIDITVFLPLFLFLFICIYFMIKTLWQTQNYYIQMKLEKPQLKDRIKKYKGSIISGVITASLIIAVTIFLIFWEQVLLYDTFSYYWPILIFGGFLADVVSKTNNKGEAYLNGILTIFFISIIYFFIIMIGIILIYYGLWEHPTLYKEWYRIFDPLIILFFYSSVTVFPGEYISYGIRKLIKKLRNDSVLIKSNE